jgi:hypothetical protein
MVLGFNSFRKSLDRPLLYTALIHLVIARFWIVNLQV